MKIALDAMGGDSAPQINILGAKQALARFPHIQKLYLVGQEKVLQQQCDEHRLLDPRIEIVPASQVVEMCESPVKAIKSKKDSSIIRAVDLVKKGEAQAVVSAGNTGAAVAAATIKWRLLKGVERAGIATPLPNEYGLCNILDAGANPEAKAAHLLGYALMGTVYSQKVHKIKRPKVGILCNGEEDEKGTEFTREAFALVSELASQSDDHFEFIGNIEGNDLMSSPVDVVLCDGFVGNVTLKTCEGAAKAISRWIKHEVSKKPLYLLGGLLSKGAFKAVKDRTNYEMYGGSPLLGVNGIMIIAHGSSSPLAIENAIRVCTESIENEINPLIEERMLSASKIISS